MSEPTAKRLPVWPILIGAVVVAAVIAVFISASGGNDKHDTAAEHETGTVTVSGPPLPEFVSTRHDAAVGDTAPTLHGTNFSAAPVTIPANDGKAKAIFFVAHWCPHCQAEVPRLAKWIQTHGIPAGLDIEIVSTRVDEAPNNYPPSAWLQRDGLGKLPIITDDTDYTAYYAYGGGGLPYIVYLDKDNKVVLRTEGEYGDDPEGFTPLFTDLVAGNPVTNPQDAG